jgi:hypothetical protein
MPAFLGAFSRFSAYELVEIALLACRGSFLIEQSKVMFVELFEPLVPFDMIE